MKVAVCYDSDEMIFQHFGHTENFKIYEVADGEVVSSEIVSVDGAGHEALAVFLIERGVDTLICGGIGAGAVNALGMTGIRVFGGITGLADFAVEALARGILGYNPEPNCDHHDGEHSCGGHENDHECGCGGHDGESHACGCGG